jgi:hypothetical protein
MQTGLSDLHALLAAKHLVGHGGALAEMQNGFDGLLWHGVGVGVVLVLQVTIVGVMQDGFTCLHGALAGTLHGVHVTVAGLMQSGFADLCGALALTQQPTFGGQIGWTSGHFAG